MIERTLCHAEKRQLKAVFKALKIGIDSCDSEEQSLIRHFIIKQLNKVDRLEKAANPDFTTDDFFDAALRRLNDEKR